jgi:RecJ-like exonuclease
MADDVPLLPIAEAPLRRRCRVTGSIRSVRIRPGMRVPVFEVVIDDGTGRMVGAFWGRRTIPGVEVGAHVSLEGTPREHDGEAVMANPLYTLLPIHT